MNLSTEEREKLKGYYDSLLEQREIFSDLSRQKQETVSPSAINGFEVEVRRAIGDFPELLPPLDVKGFGYSREWNSYEIVPILTHLSACIGRLKAALEETQNTSVTERLEFSLSRIQNFVKSSSGTTSRSRGHTSVNAGNLWS